MRQEYKEDRKMIRGWFEKNEATLQQSFVFGRSTEFLTWKRPNSSIYSVYYEYYNGLLVVHGDLGDAIYQWHRDIGDLEDVSKVELDYFASKCLASEVGREYVEWDRQKAKRRVLELIRDCVGEYIEIELPDDDNEFNNTAQYMRTTDDEFNELHYKFINERGYDALNSREEWIQWLDFNGYEVFGDDCFEYANIGNKINLRCQAHLIGLKMAFEQIRKPDDNRKAIEGD